MQNLPVKVLNRWQKYKFRQTLNSAIFFNTYFGIHSFFMKHAITVLILNKNNIVVRKKVVQPNRIYFWSPVYNKVVEIPAKDISPDVGTKLNLIYNN